jgi:hypothetical protein
VTVGVARVEKNLTGIAATDKDAFIHFANSPIVV